MGKIDVIEKFLRYVKIDTQSDDTTGTSPSTMKQHDLAKLLADELTAIGASDVYYDKDHCYVYASIPSNIDDGKERPAIGFVSHMDTSDEVSGKDVKPRIEESYKGDDIVLSADGKVVLLNMVISKLPLHLTKRLEQAQHSLILRGLELNMPILLTVASLESLNMRTLTLLRVT